MIAGASAWSVCGYDDLRIQTIHALLGLLSVTVLIKPNSGHHLKTSTDRQICRHAPSRVVILPSHIASSGSLVISRFTIRLFSLAAAISLLALSAHYFPAGELMLSTQLRQFLSSFSAASRTMGGPKTKPPPPPTVPTAIKSSEEAKLGEGSELDSPVYFCSCTHCEGRS
jgi:hypothetical protein